MCPFVLDFFAYDSPISEVFRLKLDRLHLKLWSKPQRSEVTILLVFERHHIVCASMQLVCVTNLGKHPIYGATIPPIMGLSAVKIWSTNGHVLLYNSTTLYWHACMRTSVSLVRSLHGKTEKWAGKCPYIPWNVACLREIYYSPIFIHIQPSGTFL